MEFVSLLDIDRMALDDFGFYIFLKEDEDGYIMGIPSNELELSELQSKKDFTGFKFNDGHSFDKYIMDMKHDNPEEYGAIKI